VITSSTIPPPSRVLADMPPAEEPDEDGGTDAQTPDDGSPTAGTGTRRRRLSTLFAWVRNIALIVVLFAAWEVWGTALPEHHSQTQLAGQFHTDTAVTPDSDRPFGLLTSTARVPGPADGSLIARLQAPSIDLDQYVVQGTTTGDLEKGPGHVAATAVPGQAGNIVIAGHRTTYGAPFGRLDALRPGDPITLTTTSGQRLIYRVAQPSRVVSPSDLAILTDAGDDRLTLLTSTPKYSAAQRLVVVARLSHPSTGSPSAGPPPGPTLHMPGTGWNVNRLPFVGLLVALLLLLGLAYRRPSRSRRLLTLLVLTPIWLAGLFLLFQALTNVLPSTI
jgi:LPXTG-site transpeptidase (sortase) family protein